jgi:hypothetical protein
LELVDVALKFASAAVVLEPVLRTIDVGGLKALDEPRAYQPETVALFSHGSVVFVPRVLKFCE